MKKNIVILGSCGTRDTFRVIENSMFELLEYTARTSFASQFSERGTLIKKSQLDNLSSGFQKRMVLRDFEKRYFNTIDKTQFDYLVIDFIDERCRLLQLNSKEVFTFSNELNLTKFISSLSNKGRFISPNTDSYFELWKKGWDNFIELSKELGVFDKVIVNKLYWAKKDENGNEISNYTPYSSLLIDTTNKYLSKLYAHCAKDLSSNKFLSYNDKDFIASSSHVWGPSPFHYVDNFYHLTENKLSNL